MSNFNQQMPKDNSKMKLITMVIMAILAVFAAWQNENPFAPGDKDATPKTEIKDDRNDDFSTSKGDKEVTERDLKYKGKRLILTKHAKCRMDCREIDAFEVAEVLERGKINERKSDPYDKPCPTYSLESYTRDNQRVRSVIAECDDVVKLITVIDLDNKYNCTCY